MKMGRIVGNVVATQKDEKLESIKLFMVQDVNLDLSGKASFVVAADSVGAGVGELVLYASGSSGRMTEVTQDRPIDAVIMAIVDTLTLDDEISYQKGIND